MNTKLKNKLKKILSSHIIVDDILVFGSVVRGKEHPGDIDILVIFKDKVDKVVEYDIRKILQEEFSKVSIISKTLHTIISQTFDARESILFEGKSILTGKTLGEKYGYSSYGAFKYNLKDWTNLKRTKFYYALNGRSGNEGFSDKLNCIKFSDRIVFVPLEHIEKFREFLNSWEMEFIYIPLLIPARFKKKHLE